jgi:ABC-type transporter Mla subunit MlaD
MVHNANAQGCQKVQVAGTVIGSVTAITLAVRLNRVEM